MAAQGATKATVVSQNGLRFDLRVVPPESFGNLLQHFTGSKDHNVALREAAVRQGLSVSEYGIQVVETNEVVTAEHEEDVYRRLGYDFVPPELRENLGELEAARRGELPELVESGTSGAISTPTRPGRRTRTTRSRRWRAPRASAGYEYLAATDHSHYLRDGRFAAQAEEIAALNERLAPFRILRGVEVNIGLDGSVDVPDEDLASCDWVIASLHRAFDREPTERILAAMEHPHVHCIGHPTARKIGRRAGADARPRPRHRQGARDGDVPRDQLAARPARPPRRARARGPRGRVAAGDHERRAPHPGARQRRVRRRPGAPRVVHHATTCSTPVRGLRSGASPRGGEALRADAVP